MVRFLSNKMPSLLCAAVIFLSAPASAQLSLDQYRSNSDSQGGGQQQDSALPSGGAQPRSPGLSLPTQESEAIDPFAPTVAKETKSSAEIEKMIREEAMDAALTGLLPLKPEEIRILLERFDQTQQAVEVPVYPYPKPEVLSETISLDPGVKPPVLKVGTGHVTTLALLDATGSPWPIGTVSFAGNFEVLTPEPGGHMIQITGMSEFGYGNLSLTMLELKTPITFTLKTSRDSVHYRFDARIPDYGPFAQAPIIDGGLSLVAGNSILGSILDGLPPKGSEKLDVSGVDGRTTAYMFNNTTYVRTPLTLLSPGWSGSVSSADGMNVYAVANAPVLLLSDKGNVVRAMLSEGEILDEQ